DSAKAAPHDARAAGVIDARKGQESAGGGVEDAASKIASRDTTPEPPNPRAAAEPALQQASIASVAAAPARGSPETIAHLSAQILKKLDERSTRFDVQLQPEGLGRVDVRLEIGANGRLTASLSFDNPQAAAELRGRSQELSRSLEQAGFDVSGGLSFDVAGERGQSGQGGGQQQAQTGSTWRGQAFHEALGVAGEADVIAAPPSLQRRAYAGLDIKI
ncbi:MAG: flagellar hook-length control protein FliK, partial [Phenylobacterium sp.]|uniref:flagellar hook-length control protein FliK n=1 Tax=Phenylobacterium sp. TaxID=1871053 RepID=UPI0027363ADF